MMYKVLDDRILSDHAGRPVHVKAGSDFDIINRRIALKLLSMGIIEDPNAPKVLGSSLGPLPSPSSKKRIAFFSFTSANYSGGRILLWQMAWALSDMGHEVWFVTNSVPKWKEDYPDNKNLKLITGATPALPPDFDYLITDGKRGESKLAVRYHTSYPRSKLCVINYETPNWVRKYDPVIAERMEDTVPILKKADVLLAISNDSAQDIRENVGEDKEVHIILPIVNTFAIDKENVILPSEMRACEGVPYVVWASRGSAYKGLVDAVNAVKKYPGKLNLVAIGQPGKIDSHNTADHKFIAFGTPVTDAQKMKIFAGASCIVAPSKFEGYGMVPGEALCCGTPSVVYDLPVLRDNYGDKLVYAKWGDSVDFAKKVKETVNKRPVVDKIGARNIHGMDGMKGNLEKIRFFSSKKKVSAQLICYYGPTVTEAIASVYPYVDEILIAYGPTVEWEACKPDDALNQIRAYPDPDKKIKLEVRKVWQNKTAMREWCAQNATGNRMLIFDADEIYHNLDKWIEADPVAGCPRWVHFWHNEDHYVTDSPGDQRWGTYEEEKIGTLHAHYRWSHWRRSYSFPGTRGVRGADCKDKSLTDIIATQKADEQCSECVIYHLGHTLDANRMNEKHNYYLGRDGADKERMKRKTAWHNWNGKTGSQGDGIIRKVTWELPPLVIKAFERMKGNV